MAKGHVATPKGELVVHAYSGDGAVLLAFDLGNPPGKDFAGFAIQRTPPSGKAEWLMNRLSFETKYTEESEARDRVWTPSNVAPFQKFRWVDFPNTTGEHLYRVSAMYFPKTGWKLGKPLEARQTAEVRARAGLLREGDFRMGFTRGYLSSQAYVDRFHNADIRPKGKKTIDFDAEPFEKQWDWLGAEARKLVYEFLDDAIADGDCTVDMFAYDIDEPNVIAKLVELGPRLRAFLDDAPLHTKDTAMEPLARKALTKSAGASRVKVGHFKRFAHCKVLIKRRKGKAVSVLAGSANFSVRGLYVQSNNVFVMDNERSAGLYAQAFDQAFEDPSHFSHSEIAKGWFDVHESDLPAFSVAFSPHASAGVSLDLVTQQIQEAHSSVLFAVMELGGGGGVLDEIKKLPKRDVFSYGVTQSEGGLKFYKPGQSESSVMVPFAYLHGQVPPPFHEEWSGGAGQVIHHKFVVVDFNGAHPAVFTGSSNLAAGGETSNGDTLLAIYDPEVVLAYAVEAVRLVDHYHFRSSLKKATKVKPLSLDDGKGKKAWWADYWDEANVKWRDRKLFARPPAT